MDFKCVQDCSQCCIQREYYPSKKFGKIGVLVLPEEKARIKKLAESLGITASILPRVGVSEGDGSAPERIVAYQLMGKDENGNTCPFLDTESDKRSPHGGHVCRIYEQRPLACAAYPLYELDPAQLDPKCAFCQECGHADANLESEAAALSEIKSRMNFFTARVWRYATNVGEASDKDEFLEGWIRE